MGPRILFFPRKGKGDSHPCYSIEVLHLVILFNLITLFSGLVLAGVLARRWSTHRDAVSFWRFVHFSGFTFTMAVAALDAYALVNLDVGGDLTRPWSSAVMAGCAVMTFSFPHLARAEGGRPRPPRFTWSWAGAALVPLVGGWLVLGATDLVVLLAIMGLAFLPFWASIVYGLSIGAHPTGARWKAWATFGGLLGLGAWEVWWVLSHAPEPGYFFFTLPLAYLYTVVSGWPRSKGAPRAPGVPLDLPAELATQWGLTPRELEVARGILRGLSNKELAWELGLAENTVRNHIWHLYRRLGIQKRLDLVLLVQKYQGS